MPNNTDMSTFTNVYQNEKQNNPKMPNNYCQTFIYISICKNTKRYSTKQVEVDQPYDVNLLNSCEVGITMNIFRALCKSDEYWIIWLVRSVGDIIFDPA